MFSVGVRAVFASSEGAHFRAVHGRLPQNHTEGASPPHDFSECPCSFRCIFREVQFCCVWCFLAHSSVLHQLLKNSRQRSYCEKTRAAQTPRQWKKVSKVLMILGFRKTQTSWKRHAIALMESTAAHHECGKARRSTGRRSDLMCVTLVFETID